MVAGHYSDGHHSDGRHSDPAFWHHRVRVRVGLWLETDADGWMERHLSTARRPMTPECSVGTAPVGIATWKHSRRVTNNRPKCEQWAIVQHWKHVFFRRRKMQLVPLSLKCRDDKRLHATDRLNHKTQRLLKIPTSFTTLSSSYITKMQFKKCIF